MAFAMSSFVVMRWTSTHIDVSIRMSRASLPSCTCFHWSSLNLWRNSNHLWSIPFSRPNFDAKLLHARRMSTCKWPQLLNVDHKNVFVTRIFLNFLLRLVRELSFDWMRLLVESWFFCIHQHFPCFVSFWWMLEIGMEVRTKDNLILVHCGQTHFGIPRSVKMSFDPKWTNI